MKQRAILKKGTTISRFTSLQSLETGVLAVPAPSKATIRNGDPDMIRFIQQNKQASTRANR